MATGSVQWYVKWSHSGNQWHGSPDGPFPFNEAPTQGVINVNGKTYPEISGPFPSQTAAQTFITAHPNGPNPESSTNITVPQIPNPVGGIFEVAAVFKAFFQQITRVEMWRSLAWIVGGAIMVIAGAVLWLKKEGVIPDAVPVPIPV